MVCRCLKGPTRQISLICWNCIIVFDLQRSRKLRQICTEGSEVLTGNKLQLSSCVNSISFEAKSSHECNLLLQTVSCVSARAKKSQDNEACFLHVSWQAHLMLAHALEF